MRWINQWQLRWERKRSVVSYFELVVDDGDYDNDDDDDDVDVDDDEVPRENIDAEL
jgi:hypothetical protein